MATLEEIRSKVGQEVGLGPWVEVTQDRVNLFADATGDHQWIHCDPEKAKDGPFGTTIAHGYLTLSLLPSLGGSVWLDSARMGINYGLDRVRFINPVKVGSRVRARHKLVELKEGEGFVQIKSEVTVEIEGSDKPACIAETLSRAYL